MADLERAHDFARRLFSLSKDEVERRFGASLWAYYHPVFTGAVSPEVYVHRAARLLDLCDGHGKNILDCGCGDGIDSILLALSGARFVVGVDPATHKAGVQQTLAEFAGAHNVMFVHSTIQDFRPEALRAESAPGTKNPLSSSKLTPTPNAALTPPKTFDVAIAIASLSHVPEVDDTLAMLSRHVGEHGCLLVFEDNNILRPGYKRQLERLWAEAERGTMAHKGVAPMQKLREEFLHKHISGISDQQMTEIHAGMVGLYGDKLLAAVRNHLAGKPYDNPPPHPARNPVTGETLEYPFNPYDLRDRIARLGYSASIHHCITPPWRRGLRGIVKHATLVAVNIAPFLVPRFLPTYIVVGRKKP